MTPNIKLRENYLSTPIDLFKSDEFIVEKIDGLRWGTKELATSTSPYIDGDTVQNVRGLERDIEITIKPTEGKGDYSVIFDKFAEYLGKELELVWANRSTANGTRSVTISGIMSECEAPMFEDGVRIVFTIHCANPYWIGAKITSTGTSVTIEGTAPPVIESVETSMSLTLPWSADGKKWLRVGNWKFAEVGGTEVSISGALLATPPNIAQLGSTSIYDYSINGMSKTDIPKKFQVSTYNSGSSTYLPFTINYYPRYY